MSSLSQFFDHAPLLFFIGLGFFQTYVAGLLNISSTAGIEFKYFHFEPIVYAALLLLDYGRILEPSILIAAYSLLVGTVFLKYALFVHSITIQLTKYLDIPFLTVKQKKTN